MKFLRLRAAAALTLLLALTHGVALAQPTAGLRVGINAAYLRRSGLDHYTTDLAPGGLVGAFVSLPLGERIAIQPEVQYSQLGAKYLASGPTRLHLDEVTVPLLLKVFLVKKRIHIHAGPQIGFMTRVQEENDSRKLDLRSVYRSSDYGVIFGIGANLPLRLTLDLRYVYGLANIDRALDTPQSVLKVQQRAVQLLLGLRLLK